MKSSLTNHLAYLYCFYLNIQIIALSALNRLLVINQANTKPTGPKINTFLYDKDYDFVCGQRPYNKRCRSPSH